MIENGVYINILIDLLISSVLLIFVYSLYSKYYDCNENTKPSQISLMMVWGMIFIYFILDVVRHLMFISENNSLQLQLYILSLTPLTLMSVPIVFIIIYILTGNKYMGSAVSSVFFFFSFIYIYITIQSGEIGINTTSIGYIITSNNNIANTIFLSALFIVPTSMILGLFTLIFLKQIPTFRKHKICLSLISISMVYDFLLLSSISQTGEMIIAAKIFIFIGIVLGYLSNFTPEIIASRYCPNISVIE